MFLTHEGAIVVLGVLGLLLIVQTVLVVLEFYRNRAEFPEGGEGRDLHWKIRALQRGQRTHS